MDNLDTIQPLLDWIANHPQWSGLVIFLIAAGESLVLVGVLVPGVVLMLGVGTLVGLGVLDIWTSMLWAAAGAIVGDGFSYWLGYHYHQRLQRLWPLSRYPTLVPRGEAFFRKHGRKSVFLGRFIGPIRAIIPAIAGMMEMPKAQFYTVNVLSAILWAPVVILPGALFGASLADATQLYTRITIIIVLLVIIIFTFIRLRNKKMDEFDEKGKLSEEIKSPVFAWLNLISGHEPYQIFIEGDELYDAMILSIESAKSSVRLESYIFADDEVGRRFAEAMIGRAKAGVKVKFHIDAAGSLFWVSRKLENDLKNNGVEVRWFHRWSWKEPYRYNRRNHRKLLVIDEEQVYLGGYNIHRENSRKLIGDDRWRDTHIAVSGVLAREAAALFDIFWIGKRRWAYRQDPRVNALIPNHTIHWRKTLRRLYSEGLRNAKFGVYLSTPYFVPDRRLQQELVAAAKRGIDVRILLPRKSDTILTKWAAWAAYAKLLEAGVRIYEYLPRVLHTKTAVVGGSWAMIGTANLDYRSFFVNFELNLLSRDPRLCSELKQQFFTDLGEAEEILLRKWVRRPAIRHVAELIGWIARRWL